MPKPVQTKLHKKVRKLILNAISTFDMIQPKDKVLIWISGWKDSMLLAKMLAELRDYSHLDFEIKWVHIHREFVNQTVNFEQFYHFLKNFELK